MNFYLKKSFNNKKFILILTLVIILILVTTFANYFAPYDPIEQNYEYMLQAPNSKFIFGTDYVGRDIFSRVLYGGRTSLLIALAVTFLIAVIGIVIGMLSAYVGGVVDTIIMRFIDMIMAFPYIVFVIAMATILGTGMKNLILAMTLISWTGYARVTRSMVMSFRKNDFIHQARLGGANNFQIITRYLLPNVFPYLIVMITQDIANNLLTLSSLSLLGIGVQPPTPEWGLMLSEGKKYMQTAPWNLFYPGMVILICVIVFNLLGDTLRDILDPKDNI